MLGLPVRSSSGAPGGKRPLGCAANWLAPLMTKKICLLALAAVLTSCRKSNVRGLDAHPEVPASLDFGLIAVDQVKAIPITISNTGQIELSVQDLQIKEPFDVEMPPDAVVPGGSSDVLVKFAPVQPGEITGTLTLATSSLEAPLIQVALHGIAGFNIRGTREGGGVRAKLSIAKSIATTRKMGFASEAAQECAASSAVRASRCAPAAPGGSSA